MATQTIDIRVVDKTQRSLSNIERRLGQVENSLIGVGKVAGIAATALGAIGGANLVRGVVNTTARFQDLRTALSSVTGSAEAGAEAFEFVSNFATQTQFGVETLSNAFIKLKAAGIEPTQELLTTFTDTAAVTTDQIGSLTAITDLFARTTSGGLGLEELNRLADRGIPVFKILEEQLGITRLEVSEFGKTADGARKITEALTRGLNQSFGGATADRVNNLSTAMSNFQIGVDNVADAVGRGGLGPALTGLINQFNEILARITPLAKQFGERLGFAVFQFGKFLEGTNFNMEQFLQGAQIAISVLGGAGLLKVLQAVTGGVKALTLAVARNPLGLLAVAVSGALVYLSMENGLGRTISQVIAVMGKLGDMAGSIATYFRNQLGKVIDFLTGVFDSFVDSVISGYNAIADFIPFLDRVEVTGKQVREGLKDLTVQGFEVLGGAMKKGADIVVTYVDENETLQDAISRTNSIIGTLTKTFTDAGLSYDEATAKSRQLYLETYGLNTETARVPEIQKVAANAIKETGNDADLTKKKLQDLQESLGLDTSITDLGNTLKENRKNYQEYVSEVVKLDSKALEHRKNNYDEVYLAQLYYQDLQQKALDDFYGKIDELENNKIRKFLENNILMSQSAKRALNIRLSDEQQAFLQDQGKEELKKSMVQDRIEFEKKSELEKTQFGIEQTGKFLSALGQSNKKAFEAAKAFNIANAIMNTYAGATKALATYPPPFNFIAAAAVVASGLAQVSAIRSQQYQGRQRGGALSVGQGTVVGEDGPEIIVPKQPGTVIPREVAEAIGGMNGGGDIVNVNFNISTVDAEGFDELLVRRRGTIVGIINNALQKRGKQGVA